jgi:hypothetical protein
MDALEYNTSSAYQTQIYDQIINNIIYYESKTSEKFGKYNFYIARNHRGDPTYVYSLGAYPLLLHFEVSMIISLVD